MAKGQREGRKKGYLGVLKGQQGVTLTLSISQTDTRQIERGEKVKLVGGRAGDHYRCTKT